MTTPAHPTQIAIPYIIMCLMQYRIASIAGIEQLMHPPRIPINRPFSPFTPPSSSVLFTHKPSLRYWLAICPVATPAGINSSEAIIVQNQQSKGSARDQFRDQLGDQKCVFYRDKLQNQLLFNNYKRIATDCQAIR